ncbi:GntP family permease [Roseomonas marmotae]|uniref:GntP family permease n=1 Tax=Roseomonas marmotae TaxID=2768161 RepID=A0ABS3K7G9_9PROT|nr:GntP family permease [Roseomonas marmotae]MBO1073426.1 GntP family permease [Roseomonas marmotae]QTI80379.1 GntP family permease [Roseomonas marmotae]
MIGILAIVLSLIGLMYFAYRGYSVLILAPVMAAFAVIMAQGGPVLATYTQIFMSSLGRYVVLFFPIFMLGAIFGKMMADSGASTTIAHTIIKRLGARHAIAAVTLACGLLTYGGVSLFVVAFAIYPIAAALFREAHIPKRLIAGAIALGSFTFTMTALPGTPAIQNAIPTRFFGTTTFAAPGLGIIAAAIMLFGGLAWLGWRQRRAQAAGEGYGDHKEDLQTFDEGERPGFFMAVLPIIVVIGLNGLCSLVIFPRMDLTYLAEQTYGNVQPSAVIGTWALIVALVGAILTVVIGHRRYLRDVRQTLNQGTAGSMLPIFNTASEVGYGAVIASLAAFLLVRDAVLAIAPGTPTISMAVAINALAGITGSASGGLSIALDTLGGTYLERAAAAGISPELLHRIAAIASGGFDSLPHNGAVISLLTITALSHRQSYFDIFIVNLMVPVIALVTVITLGTTFGSF